MNIVNALLVSNSNVNACDSRTGKTPLLAAAAAGNTDCVKLLLCAAADVFARNSDGSTALFVSAEAGCFDCVELLIHARSDINAEAKWGNTPLIAAARDQDDFMNFSSRRIVFPVSKLILFIFHRIFTHLL